MLSDVPSFLVTSGESRMIYPEIVLDKSAIAVNPIVKEIDSSKGHLQLIPEEHEILSQRKAWIGIRLAVTGPGLARAREVHPTLRRRTTPICCCLFGQERKEVQVHENMGRA